MRLLPLLFSLIACMSFECRAADSESPGSDSYLKDIVEPTRAMKLGSLRNADLNGMAGELRLWYIDSWSPEKMVRFVIGPHGEVFGESYLYVYDDQKEWTPVFAFIQSMIWRCDMVGKSGNVRACREQNISAQKFAKAYSTIAAAGVWTLPNGLDVDENSYGPDGGTMVVELRSGKNYRAYLSSSPAENDTAKGKLAGIIISTVFQPRLESSK